MKFLHTLSFLLISILSYSQQLPKGALSSPKNFYSTKELQEDFGVFRAALENYHPGLYEYISKAQLDSIFNNAYYSIIQPMSIYEFHRLISSVLSKIGDGHSYHNFSKELSQFYQMDENLFPLDLINIDDKLIVHQTYIHQDDTLSRGSELLAINGVSADSLLKIFRNCISNDGHNKNLSRHYINAHFSYFYSILIGNSPEYEVILKQNTFSEQWILINPKYLKLGESIRNYPQNNFFLTFIDSLSVAVWRIPLFVMRSNFEGKTRRYKHEEKKAISSLKKNKVKYVIIDLRDNLGGTMPKRLLSEIADSTCRFWKKSEFIAKKNRPLGNDFNPKIRKLSFAKNKYYKNTPNDSIFQFSKGYEYRYISPRKNGLKQKIFFLINEGSSSATSCFLAAVKDKNLGTLIGTETGGGYYGCSTFRPTIEYPNTKLSLRVSMTKNFNDVKYNPNIKTGSGVPPDYYVEMTIDDVINDRDSQMEFAFGIIRKLQNETL